MDRPTEAHQPEALPRIGHLLLIVGATSAGKTTFLADLMSGRLQPEIRAMFPEGVENWFLLPKRHSEQDAVIYAWKSRGAPRGVILEYTLNNRKGTKPYLSDPNLRLVRAAASVTALTLRATPERFASQLRHLACPGAWWRRALKSKKWLDDQARVVSFWTELYTQPGWLDEIYECWEDYLAAIERNDLIIQQVRLEPDGEIGRNIRWRAYPFQRRSL